MGVSFAETFAELIGHRIALYGLGDRTRAILVECGEIFDIVGLLDGRKSCGTLWGRPIVSLSDVVHERVDAIIIIARLSSTLIIANRIRGFCKENGIGLFDSEGNDMLCEEEPILIDNRKSSKDGLCKKIDGYDVISFDIFDTLLMRRTLFPTDVFYFAEKKLSPALREKLPYAESRQEAERELSRSGVPTWKAIYQCMGKKYALTSDEVAALKEAEWETEKQALVVREAMLDILRYSLAKGKRVIIISDMYFSAEQLDELLYANGIEGYEKVFVSAEYGVSKANGLFARVLVEIGTSSTLHIGDNLQSDIEAAGRQGIEAVHVPSALELWKKGGFFSVAAKEAGLSDLHVRLKLGMFLSIYFNSPFSEVWVSPEQLGWMFFAPVLVDFVFWLYQKVSDADIHTILFAARDGFLIKRLFDELLNHCGAKDIESIYFLTSRRSAVPAAIRNEQDILRISTLPFSGSLSEMLQVRFALRPDEAQEISDVPSALSTILQHANELREGYESYIQKLTLRHDRKAFVDFVAVGTCQEAVEKLMEERLQGFYFLRLPANDEGKKKLAIDSLFQNNGLFAKDYFIMENILTASCSSLKRFAPDGTPEYEADELDSVAKQFIARLYDGIEGYFKSYVDIAMEDAKPSPEVSAEILHLVRKMPIDNQDFLGLRWTDPFYGRDASISEMM